MKRVYIRLLVLPSGYKAERSFRLTGNTNNGVKEQWKLINKAIKGYSLHDA